MRCIKCGNELKINSEEYCKDVQGKPLYKNFAYCNTCKIRFDPNLHWNSVYADYMEHTHSLSTGMYKQFYLSTWFIALCFAFSYWIFPAIVGIVLLILQAIENSKLKKQHGYSNELNDHIIYKEAELSYRSSLINAQEMQLNTTKQKIEDYTKKLTELKSELISEEVIHIANSLDYSSYDSLTSEECKNQLSLIQQEEKIIINNQKAINILGLKDKKHSTNNFKQILRCFNAECDNIILSVSTKNIDSLRNKIVKCFDSLNKIFEVDGISLSKDMLEYKLKELTLMHNYEKKKEEEREIQKAIKEQMLEEERVRRELDKKKKEIEKDQKQFNNEVSKLLKYMQKTQSDIEKQLYMDKIKELEEKIKALEAEKADVINREQNAKAGFVYIISNIGSFGENIYKIGMTRRLEPMDRIKELSSASVPFEFDVHAMIFSDDAPSLEAALHKHFNEYRVNKVNTRKEFFNISIDDIESYITETYGQNAEFTKIPIAREYRDTLLLAEA